MKKRILLILSLVFYLIQNPASSFPAGTQSASPQRVQTLSEVDKPSTWVDRHGHNKDWWVNQTKVWRAKRDAARNQLLEAEKAFRSTRFKNYSAAQKRAERIQLNKEIRKHQLALREAEKMLNITLPNEARMAGAPKGWLR